MTEQDQYTAEVDIWSMGCVLYFMLFARPPFYADSDDEIERLASLAQYTFPTNVPVSENGTKGHEGIKESKGKGE